MEDGNTSMETSSEIKDATKIAAKNAANAAENAANPAENAAKNVNTGTVEDRVTQQLLESTSPIPIRILKKNVEELSNEEEGEKKPPGDTDTRTPTKKGKVSSPPAKDLSPKIPPSPASPES